MRPVYNWLNFIQEALFPARCCLCDQPGREGLPLCRACQSDLPWLAHSCPRCARPLAADSFYYLCGECLKQPPPFERTLTLFRYQAPVSQLIQQFKFSRRLALAPLFSTLLAERLAGIDPLPEVIIPVPLHPGRQRERGFNQAIEIARPLGRRLGIPVVTDACLRIRQTRTQSTLTASQRRRNLRDAFTLHQPAPPWRHVTILDDVITTGSTVSALASTLRKGGIERVDCWAIARTR
jgi:ComF family protein